MTPDAEAKVGPPSLRPCMGGACATAESSPLDACEDCTSTCVYIEHGSQQRISVQLLQIQYHT